jgi:hypothetical protein
MLEVLWPLLEPGGCLLYATCSVFKCEGQAQIDAFLQRHDADGAVLDPASPGHLLTVADNRSQAATAADLLHDGFYYALIRKKSNAARSPDTPAEGPPQTAAKPGVGPGALGVGPWRRTRRGHRPDAAADAAPGR